MTNSSIKRSDKVIRSLDQGCYKIYQSAAWGKYLVPVKDPEGVKLSKFEREGIQLNKDFPKIPSDVWSRYISLCFYMCPPDSKKVSMAMHDSQLEVQVCLLRDEATLTKWKIVVPKQVVSGVRVKADLTKCIDIETGEQYKQFPPQGWLHAGSSHSHNTMDAFFSSTDDKSELTVPGLHIVVGNIDHKKREYSYRASVVLQKIRKEVDLDDVVEADPEGLEFHPDVLTYIDTVLSSNKKLLTESKSPPSPMKDAADIPIIGEVDDFFADTEFDPVDEFLTSGQFIDEEIAATVDEWIEQGVPPAIIVKTVEHVTDNWQYAPGVEDLNEV